jgi:hypothetical protein
MIVLILVIHGNDASAVATTNELAEEPKEEEGLANDPKPLLEFAEELKGTTVLLP